MIVDSRPGRTCSSSLQQDNQPRAKKTRSTDILASSVCFVTAWPVVWFLGETIQFTPWGIVSGLFWVPGASCGIYGIRNAGLAVAVGTWSSIIVVSSFIFGIVIFEEEVKSIEHTAAAFMILISGLIGMSRYAEPPPAGSPSERSLHAHNHEG